MTPDCFRSNIEGNQEIYVTAAQGGPARRITNTPTHEGWPKCAPNGHNILYDLNPGNTDIRTVDMAAALTLAQR